MDPVHILLIDSYDSFTNNLASLIAQSIAGAQVHTIQNDQFTFEELLPHLPSFSAVIIGPGPGSPTNPSDVGVIRDIWSLRDDLLLPVFGVCLGMQSLCIEFGGTIRRLEIVKHGQISHIQHTDDDIFESVGRVDAVRYHSLHATLDGDAGRYIQSLAWADDGEENGRVLMAARHRTKPFWAVQYHPESVCTSGGDARVLQNFWRLASDWSARSNRSPQPLADIWSASSTPIISPLKAPCGPTRSGLRSVATVQLSYFELSVPQVFEILGLSNIDGCSALLESVSHPGRFTIIGVPTPDFLILSYTCGDSFVRLSRRGQSEEHSLAGSSIWQWLARFMDQRKAIDGIPSSPFWGGLLGYTTYEAGVQTLEVPLARQDGGSTPDVHFAFVERSVVLDLQTKTIYIQSIIEDDGEWLDGARALLLRAMDSASTPVPSPRLSQGTLFNGLIPPKVVMPDKTRYLDKIHRAKEYLAEGQSYELCVTAQTQVILDTSLSSPYVRRRSGWELYKILRERNPAPHACYLRLGGVTMAGSSPERFLSWTREGHCQLRPIKGTVRKTLDMTRERASALLNTPKELAENLMIVDLIRHDLHGCTSGAVDVSSLFSVEEYESVYQLVSVIEGKVDFNSGLTGIDALARSLPPGSMTGAPKKRSVQLLQELEDEERQLYSGVCGYWCISGAGDFAVTIRTAFRHDSTSNGSDPGGQGDVWRIGAGGAITALSNPEEEWEEMLTKLSSTLKAFVHI